MAFITQGDAQVLETVSGTGAGVTFMFQVVPVRGDFSAVFQAKSGTTISADLQISEDGGTTWTNYVAALLTAAGAKAVAASGTTPLAAGALYRFNYTTLTGTWTILVCTN
jgi:hypothetical protein